MKKNLKKLALHRETLAELDRPSLGGAAGPQPTYAFTCFPYGCEYSRVQQTCATCNLTCTTNLC
jgi:hypothetical protein